MVPHGLKPGLTSVFSKILPENYKTNKMHNLFYLTVLNYAKT